MKKFMTQRSERPDDFSPLVKGRRLMPVAWDTALDCHVAVLIIKTPGEGDEMSDDESGEESEGSGEESGEESEESSDESEESSEESKEGSEESSAESSEESSAEDIKDVSEGKAGIGKDGKPLLIARGAAAAGGSALASRNPNVARRNEAIIDWLEDLYKDDIIISAIRQSTPKEAVVVWMLRDQIQKVNELVKAHHKQFPTPRNALPEEFYFKRVTMEHLASLLRRGTNWMRQCISAAKLMETKTEANNNTVKKYLTTNDNTKFGVASFLNYLKAL
jgi:hypothetical protein